MIDDYKSFLRGLAAHDEDLEIDIDDDEADETPEPVASVEEIQHRRFIRSISGDDEDDIDDEADPKALVESLDRQLEEVMAERRREEITLRLNKVLDRKLAEELAALQEKKDAQGHDHKRPGPGGGQFTGKGDGGSGSASNTARANKAKDDAGDKAGQHNTLTAQPPAPAKKPRFPAPAHKQPTIATAAKRSQVNSAYFQGRRHRQ